LSEHEELVAALSKRDPDWAGSVMTAHIRRAYHVYIDRLGTPEEEPVTLHAVAGR
jgi:DNA-binding FadR family transcriptional regulator